VHPGGEGESGAGRGDDSEEHRRLLNNRRHLRKPLRAGDDEPLPTSYSVRITNEYNKASDVPSNGRGLAKSIRHCDFCHVVLGREVVLGFT